MIYAEVDKNGKVLRTQTFQSHPGLPWVPYQEVQHNPSLEELKELRSIRVSGIIVEVSGKLFDGDEDSQNRMNRAITALTVAKVPSTMWKLADNTWASVTLEELATALLLSGLKQTELWSL